MNKSKKYKYFRKNRCDKNSKHKTRKIQRGGNGEGDTLVSGANPKIPEASGQAIITPARVLTSPTGKLSKDVDYKDRNMKLHLEFQKEQARQAAEERIREQEYQARLAAEAKPLATAPASLAVAEGSQTRPNKGLLRKLVEFGTKHTPELTAKQRENNPRLATWSDYARGRTAVEPTPVTAATGSR